MQDEFSHFLYSYVPGFECGIDVGKYWAYGVGQCNTSEGKESSISTTKPWSLPHVSEYEIENPDRVVRCGAGDC